MKTQILFSEQDRSVNWISEHDTVGKVEVRYVRRSDDYFIAYLSSQTGCNRACRFCFLTQTGQTKYVDLTPGEIIAQGRDVLNYYAGVKRSEGKAQRVNFNWMARGEPLANPHMLKDFDTIYNGLKELAAAQGLKAKFNISTIMPKGLESVDLADVFGDKPDVFIYYSLYSLDDDFRRRWLPKAMEPHAALQKIADWQKGVKQHAVIHGAFIEGENDSEANVKNIVGAVRAHGLRAKFNLVRYNPYSEKQGREPDEDVIERNFKILKDGLGSEESRIVPRVGFDVMASCGMFIS
ncbi:MAG: radical SAM enzyme, Cfr family protein [Bdellovibrionales bacterium]